MRQRKQYPFYLSGFKIGFAILGICLFLTIGFWPKFANAQTRGLGFRGLVPPAGAKQKKYKVRVEALDLPLIKTKDWRGRVRKVFVGPPGFLETQGFNMCKGQKLIIQAVSAKVEGRDILVAFEIEDEDTGREILLRNRKGEPVWWGGTSRSNSQPGGKQKR